MIHVPSLAIPACFCAIIFASLVLGAENLQWDWRRSVDLEANQTLRKAKVTKTERIAIARIIAHQFRPDMRDYEIESEQQREDMVLDTRVKMVDLNGDGIPEVIAQGTNKQGCSPTGNCPFWILQQSGHEYRLLFEWEAIQSFTIQPGRTNGFSDIVIKQHGGYNQSGITLLRYGEGVYREAGCWGAYWFVREGDTVRDLKEPRLVPCGEE
jgi:hypothetical protein